ncbi:hypothetical protein BDV12DRAFT_161579 [Aspergillus spectabilis]
MYQLIAQDLHDCSEDDYPVTRATAKPNPAVLETILTYHAAWSKKKASMIGTEKDNQPVSESDQLAL